MIEEFGEHKRSVRVAAQVLSKRLKRIILWLDRHTAKSRNQFFNGYRTEPSTVSGAILVWGQTRLEMQQMYWILADFEPWYLLLNLTHFDNENVFLKAF